jgi:hypothetical protein
MKTTQAKWNHQRPGEQTGADAKGRRRYASQLRRWLVGLLLAALAPAASRAGTLEQFIYDGIPGAAVSNLTQHASFPAQPDFVLPFNLFTEHVESAPGGQDYGSWTRGWLTPPQTGHYTFWLAADDSAELWISTNAASYPDFSAVAPVARVLAPTARGEFDRYLTQKSAALWLERGQEYFFSIYHKQGAGDGFFQAGWQLPDGLIQRPLPLQYVQPFVPQAYSGSGVRTLATTPPEIHTFFSGTRFDVDSGRPVLIAPAIEARPPVSYQWYRNGAALTGETLPWLVWLPQYTADFSAKFTRVVGSPDGFAISPDFQFNFVSNPVSFVVLRAETVGNPAGFNLVFSRPVQPETATDAANYLVDRGVTVLGAELQYGTNTQVVVVHTTPLHPDVAHRVRLTGVLAADGTPLPAGAQLVVHRGDGGIGVITDLPPPPFTPLPCLGCPPTASTNFLAAFETPESREGNRVVRVRGYLTPSETAEYLFHVSASAATFLYLSEDGSADNKRLIAFEPNWHPPRSWTSPNRRLLSWSGGPEVPVNQSEYTVGALRLEAGRRYYLEAEMPGGGGFNRLAVLMRKASDPLPPDGAPPIPGELLAWLDSDFARAPVAITQQPANTLTTQGRRAEFSVHATGSPLLKPEWLRTGLPVADANALTLVIPEAPVRDHQARYSVRVRNAFSEALSSEATLGVMRDYAGPRLTRARGSQRGNDINLTFDEPIRPDFAVGNWQYKVVAEDDGTALEVLGVELWGDELNQRFSEVRLVTAPQTPGRRYTVTALGLHDLHGNQSHGSTAAFTAWVLAPGFVLYERYDNLVGGNVQTWNQPGKLPRTPSFVEYRNSWESDQNVGDQFFARFSGYFVPDISGRHEFFMNSDDSGELWISTDSSPANLVRVAYQPTWGNRRNWTTEESGSNNTLGRELPLLEMATGEYRYMELLYKEGGGQDYADATFSRPGDPLPANGSRSALVGAVIAAWANPEGAGVELLSQPYEVTAIEGQPASLSFQARGWTWLTNNSHLAYQWQRHGTNLHLGNQAALVIPRASLADNGARFRCEFWAPASASLMTGDIVLRVVPDTTAPRLLSPYPTVLNGYAEQYWVLRVDFSEPMDLATVTNIANYRVFIRHTGQEVPVLGAGPAFSSRDVALRIGYVEGPPDFEVHLRNLRDTSAAGNEIAPSDAFVPRLQLVADSTPTRLRWNRYGDNRVLQSTGRLGPDARWTNEPVVNLSPGAAELVLPAGGPDKFYRLKLD